MQAGLVIAARAGLVRAETERSGLSAPVAFTRVGVRCLQRRGLLLSLGRSGWRIGIWDRHYSCMGGSTTYPGLSSQALVSTAGGAG